MSAIDNFFALMRRDIIREAPKGTVDLYAKPLEEALAEVDAIRQRVEDLELLCESWAQSEDEGNPWAIHIDMPDKILLLRDDGDDIVLDKDERTGLPILTPEAREELRRR